MPATQERYVFSPSRLKALRLRAGLTQTQLAFYADVSSQSVYAWEVGNQQPNAAAFPGLIAALRCELIDLYEFKNDEDPTAPDTAGSSEDASGRTHDES